MSDSWRPSTTDQRLPLPMNGSLYISELERPAEKLTPQMGGSMESELGPAWKDSIICGASNINKGSRQIFRIVHAKIPAVADQDVGNFEFTSVDIGGQQFDGVARTYIYLRTAFDESTPVAGAAMSVGPDNKFQGKGYIFASREAVKTGLEIEPVFVVERQNFVQRVTTRDLKQDEATGRVLRESVTLYYRGEQIDSVTIETLVANEAHAYWGLQSSGLVRTAEQLTADWFAVTELDMVAQNAVNSLANPARQRSIERVTPLGTDVIFAEVGTMPSPEPAIDSPHYDATAWPDHKLAWIAPADETGKLFKFWYVADRQDQDAYNFSFSQADIGDTKFDSVDRTYVTLRADFDPDSPSMGQAMADVPIGLFDGEYVLAQRKQTRIGDERLDSLYVAETLVYVARSTIASVEHEEMLGVGQGSVVTLYCLGEIPSGATDPIDTLILDPADDYWAVQEDGTVRIGKQISHRWFAITTFASLDDALEAYKLSFPSSVDLDIPDELLGVAVVWNSAGSNGSFTTDAAGRSAYIGDPEVSLSVSESANAECGGSIQAEIIPDLRSRKGRDIPSTAWFFYIKSTEDGLTAAEVLAKLTALAGATVLQWPLFQPATHTFIMKGQRGSARAQVSASGSVSTQKNGAQERNNKEVSSGKGVSYDYSTGFGTVVIPQVIHGAITVSNTTPPSSSYTAECSVGWSSAFTAASTAGYSIGLPIPSSSDAGNLDPTSGSTGTVTDTATLELSASVTPTSLSATTPSAIPTSGLYLVGSPRIEPYKARWFRCHAQVVDASVFTP